MWSESTGKVLLHTSNQSKYRDRDILCSQGIVLLRICSKRGLVLNMWNEFLGWLSFEKKGKKLYYTRGNLYYFLTILYQDFFLIEDWEWNTNVKIRLTRWFYCVQNQFEFSKNDFLVRIVNSNFHCWHL